MYKGKWRMGSKPRSPIRNYRRTPSMSAAIKAARRINLLVKSAKMVRAASALQRRFRARSFARRGATFMRSKYFKLLHRRWGMRP